MFDSKTDPDSLRIDPACLAIVCPAERLFGPLQQTWVVPPGWAALVIAPPGASALHQAGTALPATGVEQLLLVRTTPVTVEIVEDHLAAADGHRCAAEVSLAVRAVPALHEVQSLHRAVFAGGDRADDRVIAGYLRAQCRRTLAEFAGKRTAGDLVAGADSDAIAALLSERVNPLLRAGGLVLHDSPRVRFDWGPLDSIRPRAEPAAPHRRDDRSVNQQIEYAASEARRRNLPAAEALLRRLLSLCAEAPSAEVIERVRQFPEAERAQLYDALWTLLPPEDRTQWIVVAAGNELLCFDPNLPDAPARQRRIDGPAGPLRSVRFFRTRAGRPVLLVGAARGVYEVTARDLKVRIVHTFEPPGGGELRGGVNASAVWETRVFGTHSEVGLIGWDRIGRGPAEFLLSEQTRHRRAVRGVQVAGELLVFSADELVLACPVTRVAASQVRRFTGSIARITAVQMVGRDILAGNEIGDIWHWSYDKPPEGRCIRRGDGSPIEGLQQVFVGGISQIVFAERGAAALQSMALGDNLICRYETGGRGVRRCAVAGDLFAAIDDLREHLICWRPSGPKEPYTTIPVLAQSGYPIQDVCLVTESLFT